MLAKILSTEAAVGILVSALTTASVALFAWFGKTIKQKLSSMSKDDKQMKEGFLLLFQHGLAKSCREYIEKNSVTRYQLDILNHMFAVYKNMGGNGVIEHSMELVRKLPIEDYKR